MNSLPASAREAEAQGAARYFTGRACKRGHVAERYTKGRDCVVCASDFNGRFYAVNAQAEKQRDKIYRESNRTTVLGSSRSYYRNNRDACARRSADWSISNPGKVRAISARYRSRKVRASLSLSADQLDKLRSIYDEAAAAGLHVDHVIPLLNPRVCGLHVPWNLQLLTQHENNVKRNKFDGTFDNESWRLDL